MSSLWFANALLHDGWANDVRFDLADGRIMAITRGCSPAPGERQKGAAIPGLANVHSHAFQRGMAGLAERRGPGTDDFWSWREVMYRFLDRLTPADVVDIAAQAYAEMLESGYTRVGEFHYLHHLPDGTGYADPAEMAAAIVEAARASGIGLTLLPVFYAQGGFGALAPSPGQRRFITSVDGFAKLYDRCAALMAGDEKLGVAPHSLRAVIPDDLAEIVALCPAGPVHIHAAEQVKEVEQCLASLGARPVEWLLANMAVDPRWCLIHATHLTDAECTSLARSGAVAGLCPVTEANLGDGIFPATAYFEAGGAFGTGTDSNIAIDAASELRALEYSQRLRDQRRLLLADGVHASVGRAVFERSGVGGARALGAHFGLVEGGMADIVALDCDHPALCALEGDMLLDGWIFASGKAAVGDVWRAGRHVVAEGAHVARAAIAKRYRATVRRLNA